MVQIIALAAVVVVATAIYKIVGLIRYIGKARTTSLPYVITPCLETEVVALLSTPFLRWLYHDYLDKGQGWPRWCRFIVKDWSWEDKRLAHEEYGDVFLCVSPEGIICYSADPRMGWDVMNRRNDFTKPRDKYKLLELYGPNVATAEGKTYNFHVRITAPPFSDVAGANELVWKETLYQTKRLAEVWYKNTSSRNLMMDANSLTLAVISLAGFGKRVDWTSNAQEDIPKGYKLSFLTALSDTTRFMVAILMFPKWLMNLTPWSYIPLAHSQLENYMREMIRSEREQIKQNTGYQNKLAKGNLLTSVLKSSAAETGISQTGGGDVKKHAFSEDEVMGNLFIYLLAGYETTANAIIYGLVTLALRPDLQDNIFDELDRVNKQASEAGRQELSYKEDFPQLQYLYGFMYETFRLFPGVTLITKVAMQPQEIVTEDLQTQTVSKHFLPAGTRVYLSAPAVHYHPKIWPEPYKLDPSRWNLPTDGQTAVSSNGKNITAADKTRQMRGSLLTFSDGSRACLGRKFAQAEYMAFFAELLRDHRIELAPGSDAKAIKRDLYLKCAGKVTLAPLENFRVVLKKRDEAGGSPPCKPTGISRLRKRSMDRENYQ